MNRAATNPNSVPTANPLGTESVIKLTVRYAVPSVISLVVNSLYNMVDQIFIGQGVGYLGNAATNVIMPMTLILMAIAMMFGNGASSFMSLQLGKKEPVQAAHGVGNMITLTIGAGIFFLVLFEIFLEPLCWLFGARGEVMSYAMDYGRIIVLGFPVFVIGVGFGNIIRADGRPKASMAGMSVDGNRRAGSCSQHLFGSPFYLRIPLGRQRRSMGYHYRSASQCRLLCFLPVPS